MNNLEEIGDEVIQRAFPEFMAEDIQVEYDSLDDAFFEVGRFIEEGYHIRADRSLAQAPRAVLEGGLAHELSHLLVKRQLTRMDWIRDNIVHWASRRYRTLDERDTDLQAILRGYGPQLLALLEYSEQQGFSHYKDSGLSIREVRFLLQLPKKDL